MNLATWFVDRNLEEGRGDRVALHGDAPVTYAELARLTNRVGNVLLEAGVRPEDRVLLALSDGVEFVATWFGALKIGAVVAEVYTFLRPKDYAYYLEYTNPRVVVVDESTLEAVREAMSGMRFAPRLLVAGDGVARSDELSFAAASDQAAEELEPFPTSKDAIALWKFTTGSTGA